MSSKVTSIFRHFGRAMAFSFASGAVVGCFPNDVTIRYENKRYDRTEYNRVPLPLLFGLISSTALVVSPLLVANYVCNGTYFDKWVDEYVIELNRYHQFDGNNNKYAFPSLLALHIRPNKDVDWFEK